MHRPLRTAALRSFPLVAAIAALAPRPAVSDDADARRRLFEEAPAAWEKMEAYTDGLVVEGEMRFSPFHKQFVGEGTFPFKYARSGESSRFEAPGVDGSALVTVLTPGDSFRLRRETASSPYRVESHWPKQRTALLNLASRFLLGSRLAASGVEAAEAAAREDISRSMARSFTLALLTKPFSIGENRSFAKLIQDPNYHVKSVESVSRDGRELVRVEFDYRPAKPTGSRFQGGWCLFDPSRLWALDSAEFVHDFGRSFISIEYGDDDQAGYPAIRRADLRSAGLEGEAKTGTDVHEIKLTSWRRQAIPASEFELSALRAGGVNGVPVASNLFAPRSREPLPLAVPATPDRRRGVASGGSGE